MSVSRSAEAAPLRRTPLYDLHRALGARMVPFAGYEMPVQYPAGIIAEHLHTRAQAGLFDVSHMGQIALRGDGAARALETLVPGDLKASRRGACATRCCSNEAGGILDDLMVDAAAGRRGLMLVVNAARKEADLAHLRQQLGSASRSSRSPTARCWRCRGRRPRRCWRGLRRRRRAWRS